jgi:hypothetical protein
MPLEDLAVQLLALRDRPQRMKFSKAALRFARYVRCRPPLYSICGKLTLFSRFETPHAGSGVLRGVNTPGIVLHRFAGIT